MNEIIIFILGSLTALFLGGMVYPFIGVLKMQKNIKRLNHNERSLNDFLDKEFLQIQSRISDETRHTNNELDELRKSINHRISEENKYTDSQIDELRKYIDSRIDKALNQQK
jgi:CHASE3 domain sensor protein